METFWLVLIGFFVGASLLGVYVFTVAARNYVSEKPGEKSGSAGGRPPQKRVYVERSWQDRRQASGFIHFPLHLPHGEVVMRDRRVRERRMI